MKKKCTLCPNEKDRTEFYPHKRTKDKLQPHCKECQTRMSNEYKFGLREEIQAIKDSLNKWHIDLTFPPKHENRIVRI